MNIAQNNPTKEIWYVAAGTGGHIYPGLTLARELQQRRPQWHPVFFGTADRLEAKLVPEAGFELRFVNAGRWKGQGPLARLLGLLALAGGFLSACVRVSRKPPVALVSAGGYVSLPLAMACWLRGVPVFLLEPNIIAGISNRVVSRWARAAFCSPGSNARSTLRCAVEELGTPVRALAPAEIRPQAERILALGGSQGAKAVCEGFLRAAAALRREAPALRFTLQCGPRNLAESEALKAKLGLGKEVQLRDYIQDVPAALREADVVVARAGAMTVTELSVSGHPVIFVPFPFAADDHQRHNARLLADDGAALMVEEGQSDFAQRLTAQLRLLCLDAGQYERRKRLSQQLHAWGRPQATQDIASRILSLCGAPAPLLA